MPLKRRQNLTVTDRETYYKEERLKEFLDSKGAFYNGNESGNEDESYHENNNSSSYWRVLPIVVIK